MNSKRIAQYNGQDDDWWLRSPNADNDYYASYVNWGGGGSFIGVDRNDTGYSGGRSSLRQPATSMRMVWVGMATSTDLAVWIEVPAGIYFTQIKINFHSPYTSTTYNAWYVDPGGEVDLIYIVDLVTGSGGRSSPYVYTDYDACYVYNGGGIGISGDDDVHWNSCGFFVQLKIPNFALRKTTAITITIHIGLLRMGTSTAAWSLWMRLPAGFIKLHLLH